MTQTVRKPSSIMLLLVAGLRLASQTQPGMGRTLGKIAQPPPGIAAAVTETLTYDHVHLGVPDPAKAVEWYAKYIGLQPGTAGEPNDRLLFGKIDSIFLKTYLPLPGAAAPAEPMGL